MRQYFSKLPRSTEELLHWYERYVSPVTLITGFLIDAVIFRNVDFVASIFLLSGYLTIAAAGIVLFHLIQSGRLKGRLFLQIIPLIPAAIQFAFGALFSGFVILYSQSAAVASSWIFIAILAVLLVGNERFRTLYTQFAFQATIFFTALISYVVFFLPVMTLRIGTEMFLVSEAIAVVVMVLLLRAFGYFAPGIIRGARWRLLRSIGSILLIFNVLYFTNAIPPIPLALKEAGVYHDVQRTGDVYALQAEPLEWYQQYLNYNTTFHRAPGERVYVFSAIYAPPRLSTTIVHEWQYYDEAAKSWETRSSVSFPISGGREGGYRGYTILSNAAEGRWRVNVRNQGKLIGRVSFRVENVETPSETVLLER
ncbi:MAG TPA: DUF2914 domain-containing protein [Candidatus Paceibacterota bacterium]|nr:DUF2914 domain-containing protein [Candidatus Paceibacterota bacterium]